MAFLERLKLRRGAGPEDDALASLEPPEAPRLRTRLTDLGQLIFPKRGPRRLHPSAGLEAAPPDPAKVLFPAGESGGRAGQYSSVEESLLRDARRMDGNGTADIIGRRYAAALVDRAVASAVGNISYLVLMALAVGFIGFFVGLVSRAMNKAAFGVFSYGALYFFLGAIVVWLVVGLMGAAGKAARRRLRREENNLIKLVEETTGDFHDRLVRLRATMEANAASDFPKAISAASEARLVTVSALRFYESAPIIDADSGEKSDVLTGYLRANAGAALRSSFSGMAAFAGALAAFAGGAAAVYYGAASPPDLARLREAMGAVLALEATEPGRVTLFLAIAAAIMAPIFLGPLAALASIAADPRAFLASRSVAGLVNGLHASALAAAAERKRELIERYADALLSLERRSEGWAARSGQAGEDDVPHWRRPPEAPRFVETGFQAAPQRFVADPKTASDGANGRRQRKIF